MPLTLRLIYQVLVGLIFLDPTYKLIDLSICLPLIDKLAFKYTP